MRGGKKAAIAEMVFMKSLIDQLKSVKASLEIEGLMLTDEMQKLVLQEAKGIITFFEFQEKAKELVENVKSNQK